MAKAPVRISRLPIAKVAFGVQYNPQYGVRDNIGRFIDRILDSEPFGPDTFPLSQAGAHDHVLHSRTTGDQLTVTQSDILLDVKLMTTSLDKVFEMARKYDQIILKNLKSLCSVNEITRFGLLIRFDPLNSLDYECPTVRYMDTDMGETARTLALRFSYQLPTHEGFERKGVEDYRNIIYSLNQDEEETFFLSVDCQQYFNPELSASEWDKKPYSTFAEGAISYHQNKVSSWVNRLAKPNKAAA